MSPRGCLSSREDVEKLQVVLNLERPTKDLCVLQVCFLPAHYTVSEYINPSPVLRRMAVIELQPGISLHVALIGQLGE